MTVRIIYSVYYQIQVLSMTDTSPAKSAPDTKKSLKILEAKPPKWSYNALLEIS